jgi:PiT family inorganic phosphate transporter
MPEPVLLGLVIAGALGFAFSNGARDATSAVSTAVSTRALRASQAILLARTMILLGALCGTAVAATVGRGLVDLPERGGALVALLAALAGAVAWSRLARRFHLPVSSTQALVGGLLGAGLAAAGAGAIAWRGVGAVAAGLVLAPLAGFSLAIVLVVAILWALRGAGRGAQRAFRTLQVASAAGFSFGHGLNDAQSAMGVMTLALFAHGAVESFDVPLWVRLSAGVAMSLGTGYGGYRAVRTMTLGVAKIEPVHGFAAETGAGLVIGGMSWLGVPISTTHCLATSVMGAGASRRPSAMRWPTLGGLALASVATIPGAAVAAAVLHGLLALAGLA